MDRKKLLSKAIFAAIEAGNEIINVYNSNDLHIVSKSDNSPLTLADTLAHNKIHSILNETNIPILSEEGISISFSERQKWECYWLIDPLDGTKEFIKRNDEFTVNIALINNGELEIGVVYTPVLELLHFGMKNWGAYKKENCPINLYKNLIEIETSIFSSATPIPFVRDDNKFIVVASRSHMSDETAEYINKLEQNHKNLTIVSKGSSLKLCLIAEGSADIYPRFGPTMEWDTAAGQAIIEASGGSVISYNDKQSLKYNKESLLNPSFIALKKA